MKTTLFMAMSLNGIVARENNDEDFISDDSWETFVKLTRKTGCLIWGRKTFEVVKTWDKNYLDQIKEVRKVIVSNQKFELDTGCELANSPQGALEILEKMGYKEVILCGGAINNSSFAKDNLIDEIIFNIEPVLIGKGLPIFSPQDFDLKLEFMETKKLTDNIVQLRYKVIK